MRKLIVLLIVLLVIVSVDAAGPKICGDVNNDGTANIFDLLNLLKILAGESSSGYYPDVNYDGKTNIYDLNSLLGIISDEKKCEYYDVDYNGYVDFGDIKFLFYVFDGTIGATCNSDVNKDGKTDNYDLFDLIDVIYNGINGKKCPVREVDNEAPSVSLYKKGPGTDIDIGTSIDIVVEARDNFRLDRVVVKKSGMSAKEVWKKCESTGKNARCEFEHTIQESDIVANRVFFYAQAKDLFNPTVTSNFIYLDFPECKKDSDCASNEYCFGNSCLTKQNDGKTCTNPNECLGGYCNNYRCASSLPAGVKCKNQGDTCEAGDTLCASDPALWCSCGTHECGVGEVGHACKINFKWTGTTCERASFCGSGGNACNVNNIWNNLGKCISSMFGKKYACCLVDYGTSTTDWCEIKEIT